jgi:site-specific recombinase XerD
MSLLIENFYKYMTATCGLSDSTGVKYTSNVQTICELLSIDSVEQLKGVDFNAVWQADLWEIARKIRGINTNTVIGYQSALKRYIKFLEESNVLPKNSHAQIRLAKPDDVHIFGLSKEEKKSLREYIANHLRTDSELRDAALVMFMWGTGCRISEALRLNVHKNGLIYTDDPHRISGDFRIDSGDVFVHFEHGKNHRDRSIPVPPESIAYVNLYLSMRTCQPENRHILWLNNARNVSEARLLRGGAINRMKIMFENAGVNRPEQSITHALRHTAIEQWLLNGVSTKRVVAMCGMRDELSLEAYFKRSRELVRTFGRDNNSLADISDINPKIKEFEKLLRERYFK